MPDKKSKKPVLPRALPLPKTPHFLGPPNIENGHLAWRFSRADVGGPYTCGNFCIEDFQQLWEHLRSFEKMNVAQLRAQGSFHDKQTVQLDREKKERLKQIELDDVETLYSFRITGRCRMWCMRHENIFLVLWWDKDHEVVPVHKRNT